ncbi:MAG: MOSC domain-containing protein [Vicingaceae bacterium]
MKIVSTNIGLPVTVLKNGKEVRTGIYKKSVNQPISLGFTDVVGDTVVDRKHHGGIDKACYLYSANHYPFWKEKFPELEWTPGMFGENLTVEGLDEAKIMIGDIFEIGTAVVQVSEPRRPCSILGIRFGTQQMVKQFFNANLPGIYVRVLKEGNVQSGDTFILKETTEKISIKEVYSLFSDKNKNLELAKKSCAITTLSKDCKNAIKKRFNI